MEVRERFRSFGDPDAGDDLARSDQTLEDLFVETDAIGRFLRQDRSAHVIVGSKGTGKSLLMFKKVVMTTKKPGVLIAPRPPLRAYTPAFAFAGAEDWIEYFASLFDRKGRPDRERWAYLWFWALLSSLLHAWHRHLETVEDLDSPTGEALQSALGDETQDNPYILLAGYLKQVAEGVLKVRGRPVLPEVGPKRDFLLNHVNSLPPPYIFLDNQDDLFPENPVFWTAMGAGCFRALRELHQLSGHRVHVFLTLRPEIVWELRKDPNYARFYSDIFHLRWQDAELLRVFETRARLLNPDLLPSPGLQEEKPLGAFLGPDLYDKKSRSYRLEVPSLWKDGVAKYQDAFAHLLRHTLRRPRDIIILGNEILKARENVPTTEVNSAELIREAVDEAASSIIARNYIREVRHRWPWGGDSPRTSLQKFICTHVNKNLLAAREVRRIEQRFAAELGLSGEEVDPFRRLASFGLVGWAGLKPSIGKMQQTFLWPGDQNLDSLPGDVEWFLVHPLLYADPFFVKPVPGLLVGPGLPFPSNEEVRRLAYYSCFICYGKPDEDFAQRLSSDLRDSGVDCWFYLKSAKPGKLTWVEIKKRIRESERCILICSSRSLGRGGVKREIEEMIDSDADRLIPLSLDHYWRESGFEVRSGDRDLKPFLMERNLAKFEGDYVEGLESLLAALTRPPSEVAPHRP